MWGMAPKKKARADATATAELEATGASASPPPDVATTPTTRPLESTAGECPPSPASYVATPATRKQSKLLAEPQSGWLQTEWSPEERKGWETWNKIDQIKHGQFIVRGVPGVKKYMFLPRGVINTPDFVETMLKHWKLQRPNLLLEVSNSGTPPDRLITECVLKNDDAFEDFRPPADVPVPGSFRILTSTSVSKELAKESETICSVEEGDVVEVEEVISVPDEDSGEVEVRARIADPKGYISLTTSSGSRCAEVLDCKAGRDMALEKALKNTRDFFERRLASLLGSVATAVESSGSWFLSRCGAQGNHLALEQAFVATKTSPGVLVLDDPFPQRLHYGDENAPATLLYRRSYKHITKKLLDDSVTLKDQAKMTTIDPEYEGKFLFYQFNADHVVTEDRVRKLDDGDIE
eukprot:TRINITY_DN32132_c0_g1_i3.p1 TRINITY_DN32132_c0_g1~~TRINITY_DN32132_c0_g1_i3.p1  ORF type:complete len:408 (-),score=69.92 TRINITY_DN32132_c0_g1_i3:83-1306(-)